VVVVAAPGAGKTTRVPPALAADGPVILLQPRRVAARTIAKRIADEQGWTLGGEVVWHVRFDKRFSATTRLLVATEGILTARLQQDPLLTDFSCIILDEFHERSIHADLGIALAKQAWKARDDLRVVIMSATLDAKRASDYFDGCPVFDIAGTLYPLDLAYRPGMSVTAAVQEATGESVELAYVEDRGYTGEEASAEAEAKGIRLEVVKHPDAKKGFVLFLPRRWVVERSFAWASRFRRLAKDYERLPQTVAGLHFVAFACLFLHRAITALGSSP